ncbi:MAG: hypothetical protein FWG07_03070 [Treponema sp.]|nr:hypothetical protein [Treponema sp.]
MKNTIKFFGIVALVAIIGFSFTACDNGSSDGIDKSGTFSATIFKLTTTDYNSVFGTTPMGFHLLTGTKTELITNVGTAGTKSSHDELASGTGLNWDQVEGTVQAKLVETGIITTEHKTMLMNAVGINGYGIGVVPLDGGYIGVAAAYRE